MCYSTVVVYINSGITAFHCRNYTPFKFWKVSISFSSMMYHLSKLEVCCLFETYQSIFVVVPYILKPILWESRAWPHESSGDIFKKSSWVCFNTTSIWIIESHYSPSYYPVYTQHFVLTTNFSSCISSNGIIWKVIVLTKTDAFIQCSTVTWPVSSCYFAFVTHPP